MDSKDIYKVFNATEHKESHFDTWLHKYIVNKLMIDVVVDLQKRGAEHDDSKLIDPVEDEGYGKVGPLLSTVPFNSTEFNDYKSQMQPAIDTHMCNNRHHFEYHKDSKYNLLDLIEMLIDWKASGARRDDSSIEASIEIMSKRYNLNDDVKALLINTAHYLWDQSPQ